MESNLYTFEYCDCIHESTFATMSIHRTKQGAYKAMRKFIVEKYMKEYNQRFIYGKNRDFDSWKFEMFGSWYIGKMEIQD